MKLSEKIVRLRKSRGMTQEEMAERCAVTRQSISKWEADIALPETEKLSAALCKGDDPKDNWFADFKAGDRKYIVFHGKVLTYPIGNEAEKARVCAACREMGVPDEQMHWEE